MGQVQVKLSEAILKYKDKETTKEDRIECQAVMKKEFAANLPYTVKSLDAKRAGDRTHPGVDISLEEYVQANFGISKQDFIATLGINTKIDTMNNINTMPDTAYRWVVPEIIRDALVLGIRQAPIYPNLIASDQPVSGIKVTFPYINMSDAAPARVNEAETIPLGTVSYGQKDVTIFKIGKGIKITDEVKNYVSLDILSIFFRDHGIQLGYAMDALAFDTLLNGNMLDGSEAIPTIGITTPNTLVYRDLLRPWVRGARIGRDYTKLVGGEEMALDLLDLPEFKNRYQGTPDARLNVRTPVPASADFWVHGAIPDDSVMMVDQKSAMIKLTAQPIMIESERIVSNQTEAVYSSLTTGFAKMFLDGSILLDTSLSFATNGFPDYLNIDPLLLVNME